MTRAGALGAVFAAVLLTLAPCASGSTGRPAAAPVEIARLVVATPVRARPTSKSRLLARVSAVRPITLQQTSLPVLRHATDAAGAEWLLVRLPGRPPGRVGWIAATNARVTLSPWRVVIDRALRRA